MRLSKDHSSVRVAVRRVRATNYSETKDFARSMVQFLTDVQTVYRRMETAARKFQGNLKAED